MTAVLWVTPAFPWAGDPAAGVFYRTQAGAIAALGVETTVACPTPWAPWPLSRLRPRWRNLAGSPTDASDGPVRVLRPRYLNLPGEPSWAGPDRRIAGAVLRVRSAWRGADVVHGHYAITGLAAWHVARRVDRPLVLTFHGSDMNQWPDDHPDRLADLRAAVRAAAAVVAVSGALAARIEAVTGTPAMTLPLGSDHAALRARAIPRLEARRRLGLPPDRPVALFVGHLKRTKGVREFVDGVRAAREPWLGVLVGAGPELGYGGGDATNDGDRIRFAGARPHEDIPIYLSAADALVLPSHGEGLPTVLVEAGSLHVPVIASRVGGVPELLGEDRGAILPAISGEAVAAALDAFVADPDAARHAADRLADLVTSEYDVGRNAGRLVELYQRVARSDG